MTGLNRPARAGFTLLETILAVTIGFVVLMGATGVFFLINHTERVAANRSAQMQEQAIAQQVLRRALMSIVVIDDANMPEPADPEDPDSEPEPWPEDLRPRLIVDWDTSPTLNMMVQAARADGAELQSPFGENMAPQRIELVVASRPIPSVMVAPSAWAVARPEDELSMFTEMVVPNAPQEGGLRGVLELRPDGARERLLLGRGVAPESLMLAADPRLTTSPEPIRGWTLWWREMSPDEFWARQRGEAWDPDARPDLLIDAVPLMRGLKVARWAIIQGDGQKPPTKQRYFQSETTAYSEVPGYIELEMRTDDNQYVRWVFELGWLMADEFVDAPAPEDDAEGDDAEGDAPAGEQPEETETGQT